MLGKFHHAVMVFVALTTYTDLSLAGPKEDYELQERCGKRAAERFRQDWGKEGLVTDKDSHGTIRYRSNYNKNLNSCFAAYTYRSNSGSRQSTQINLFDVNTNQDIGFFFMFGDKDQPEDCWVEEAKCRSKKEWDALSSLYLGR
jgi:hypothetical protein